MKNTSRRRMAWPLILLLAVLCSATVAAVHMMRTDGELPRLPKRCPSTEPGLSEAPSGETGSLILVQKSTRKLGLYVDGRLVERGARAGPACFDIALGGDPAGHKMARNDGRTPEGYYAIPWKRPDGLYGRALWIGYPSAEDAAVALADGRIEKAEHDRILAASEASSPVHGGPLGDSIEIHGGGAGNDWTLGCIGMEDEDMDWLYGLTVAGQTMIRIDP